MELAGVAILAMNSEFPDDTGIGISGMLGGGLSLVGFPVSSVRTS